MLLQIVDGRQVVEGRKVVEGRVQLVGRLLLGSVQAKDFPKTKRKHRLVQGI